MRKDKNIATLTGILTEDFSYLYAIRKMKYYQTKLSVKRLSEHWDVLPVVIPEYLIDHEINYKEKKVRIQGQLQSRNYLENSRQRLTIYIFAQSLALANNDEEMDNCIELTATICKPPVPRKLLKKDNEKGRDITDIMLAVNNKRASYIPAICWDGKARFAATLNVSDHIKVSGRLQERHYKKVMDNGEARDMVTYELSIFKLEANDDKITITQS